MAKLCDQADRGLVGFSVAIYRTEIVLQLREGVEDALSTLVRTKALVQL